MHHHYPTTTVVLTAALGLLSVSLFAQPMKPAVSTDISLNTYKLPPYPVEVLHVKAQPGGGVSFTSYMPIAGRVLAQSETPKPKGAEFPSNAAYFSTQTYDASGKLINQQGDVFCQQKPEAANSDFAVFGTIPTDGPQRIPFGGEMSQVPARFPQVALPERWTAIPTLYSSGPGLNYANYRTGVAYTYLHTMIDPGTGRIVQRGENVKPNAEANMQKMVRYIVPQLYPATIAVGNDRQRFEGITYLFDDNDRNAGPKKVQYRTYHSAGAPGLSFDAAGTQLRDEPVQFAYNRELSFRLPIYDGSGNTIGTFNVFPGADGKKADVDPDDSRMTVVITDEQGESTRGGIWSQFDRVGGRWKTNGSSRRAAIPFYAPRGFAQRIGEKVSVFLINQQKFFKPAHESWQFVRSGNTMTATFVGGIGDGDLKTLSNPLGNVNGGVDIGWYIYTDTKPVDAYTDEQGNHWVIRQRYGKSPLLKPMEDGPSYYGDLFVWQFDAQMHLKKQGIVALPNATNAIFLRRVLTYPDGAAFVLSLKQGGNQLLMLRSGATPIVNRHVLTPNGCSLPTNRDVPNFAGDQATKRLYVVYKLTQKPHEGKLVQFDLP